MIEKDSFRTVGGLHLAEEELRRDGFAEVCDARDLE